VMNSVAYAYNAFSLAWNGGANGLGGGAATTMAVANAGGDQHNLQNKSLASLTQGFTGPPLYSATLSDYRQSAIDNIFYRGMGGGAVSAIRDLLVASILGGGMIGGPIQGCLATPGMQAAANAGRGFTLADMIDPVTSCNEIFLGAFGSLPNYDAQDTWARRCAEFVHLFVSDHLPVTAQFNL